MIYNSAKFKTKSTHSRRGEFRNNFKDEDSGRGPPQEAKVPRIDIRYPSGRAPEPESDDAADPTEDKEEEFEKEVGEEKQLTAVKETIDFKDDEPIAAPGAKAEDDGPDPNGMTYQLDEVSNCFQLLADPLPLIVFRAHTTKPGALAVARPNGSDRGTGEEVAGPP